MGENNEEMTMTKDGYTDDDCLYVGEDYDPYRLRRRALEEALGWCERAEFGVLHHADGEVAVADPEGVTAMAQVAQAWASLATALRPT